MQQSSVRDKVRRDHFNIYMSNVTICLHKNVFQKLKGSIKFICILCGFSEECPLAWNGIYGKGDNIIAFDVGKFWLRLVSNFHVQNPI